MSRWLIRLNSCIKRFANACFHDGRQPAFDHRGRVASAVVIGILCGITCGDQSPMVATDLMQLRSISEIDVAWDGSRAVFVVHSMEQVRPEDSDDQVELDWANQSHLFSLNLLEDDATPTQLTFGDRQDGKPRLNPRSGEVVFLRADENEEVQVWLLSLDGGEARQITSLAGGVSDPVWSPDGARLLVQAEVPLRDMETAPPWPDPRPGAVDAEPSVVPDSGGSIEQIRAWLDQNASDGNPVVFNRLRVLSEVGYAKPLSFKQLFLVDPGNPSQVTQLTKDPMSCRAAVFSKDGSSVVYSRVRSTKQHPDEEEDRALWRVEIETLVTKPVLSLEGWRFDQPRFSPDGKVLAYTGQQTDAPSFRQWQLGVASIEEDTVKNYYWLTDGSTLDRSVRHFQWIAGREAIVFNCASDGGYPLLLASFGLIKPAELIGPVNGLPRGVHSFAAGGGVIAYALTTWENPSSLWIRRGEQDVQVFDPNLWIKTRAVSKPVQSQVTLDTREIDYWVMPATSLGTSEDGKAKVPVALEIHGGPSAMWGPGERTMWFEFQLLCSYGYAVVYANPRGSGGYGEAFQRGNYQDWGDGPAQDVLASLDTALARNEWLDADRQVVTGGSYGGYLTAWIIAHTQRFKAAVAQRGVYDLRTFFGEGNAWKLLGYAFGGAPHDDRYAQTIEANSVVPIADQIYTPLLIMHGMNDMRTGVSQSLMLYRTRKSLGRPVEYVLYPDAAHDLSRSGHPYQRLDRLDRILEFFARFAAPNAPE